MTTWRAFLLYLFCSVLMTWPLAAGLAGDVPGDLGDSLLNMWILGWGAESLPRVLTGSMSVRDVWNANIFHPEPLALSFSEHLFGQVLEIWPVYAATQNVILCYNLLFISSFALSGLGMFLLVRELTGDRGAAVAAGLMYAFVPFRVAQIAHIQTLSSQWMPLALYGFSRATRAPLAFGRASLVPLAGGAAALLMQNWSCGYYLVFFAPIVPLFVIHQMVATGHVGDWRRWVAFAGAALVVAIGTWPFLALYLEAARTHPLERPIAEVIGFSADVYGYATAPEALRIWGTVLRAWPRAEGEVFLGVVATVFAIAAIVLGLSGHAGSVAAPRTRRGAAVIIGLVAVALLFGLAGITLTGGFITSIAGIPIRATNAPRLLWQLIVAVAALLAISPAFRRHAIDFTRSAAGVATFGLLFAVWMSLGPMPHTRGQLISGLGLYSVFFEHVPGFDGLRVPARYAMIAALFLSVLAGCGLAALRRRVSHYPAIVTAVAALVLVEAFFAPMPVNHTWGATADSTTPPARVQPPADAPAVYRRVATLPSNTVLAEFPFGDPAWELRYVYYSTAHWRRIVNGYSGGFPVGYKLRAARLQRVEQNPEEAWQTLVSAGATHAIVHRAAFTGDRADAVIRWLQSYGAREIARYEDDILYELPRGMLTASRQARTD